MRVGFTSGVFDLFHVGHLNVLRRSRLDCDQLVVAVAEDDVATQLTGRRPAVPFAERLAVVRSMRPVDVAIGRMSTDVLDLWRQVRFDVYYKGGDWPGSPRGDALERAFADLPVEIVYFPYTRHTSSARLREVLGETGPAAPADA
ncbi:adenylyltransferase/cytidyltransferase family protein [Aquipuribacter nitratireducens]|uniref:Adenylyltransferase/cytidyltransferase family protein n=1 Tax=Aquipuribacter nitratireducens TaxID=650104 RepID=A0ABW0GPM9_9MICO